MAIYLCLETYNTIPERKVCSQHFDYWEKVTDRLENCYQVLQSGVRQLYVCPEGEVLKNLLPGRLGLLLNSEIQTFLLFLSGLNPQILTVADHKIQLTG